MLSGDEFAAGVMASSALAQEYGPKREADSGRGPKGEPGERGPKGEPGGTLSKPQFLPGEGAAPVAGEGVTAGAAAGGEAAAAELAPLALAAL